MDRLARPCVYFKGKKNGNRKLGIKMTFKPSDGLYLQQRMLLFLVFFFLSLNNFWLFIFVYFSLFPGLLLFFLSENIYVTFMQEECFQWIRDWFNFFSHHPLEEVGLWMGKLSQSHLARVQLPGARKENLGIQVSLLSLSLFAWCCPDLFWTWETLPRLCEFPRFQLLNYICCFQLVWLILAYWSNAPYLVPILESFWSPLRLWPVEATPHPFIHWYLHHLMPLQQAAFSHVPG